MNNNKKAAGEADLCTLQFHWKPTMCLIKIHFDERRQKTGWKSAAMQAPAVRKSNCATFGRKPYIEIFTNFTVL
jgi:hypothetical protein